MLSRPLTCLETSGGGKTAWVPWKHALVAQRMKRSGAMGGGVAIPVMKSSTNTLMMKAKSSDNAGGGRPSEGARQA